MRIALTIATLIVFCGASAQQDVSQFAGKFEHKEPQQQNMVRRRRLELETKCVDNTASYGGVCASTDPSPLCTPFRSPDFCPLEKSFPLLIKNRSLAVIANSQSLLDDGRFFQELENKIKGYIFSARVANVRAPKIYFCTSDIPNGLSLFDDSEFATGFVIRATDKHSSDGIYVLPNGFNGPELLTGITSMSRVDVMAALSDLDTREIIIEEFIEGQGTGELPTEYKVHVFNGEIGSINVVYNRGSTCACWAEVDTAWNRLDKYGCFTPSGSEVEEGQCYAIDYATGARKNYPMKGLDLCGPINKPDDCLINDIVAVAKDVSKTIGAYVRIDMFVSKENEVVVQEYSTNHMGGSRHCSARVNEVTGCVDSCFLGEMWQSTVGGTNALFGGPPTDVPAEIRFASELNETGLCEYAMNSNQIPKYVTTCSPSSSPSQSPSETVSAAPSAAASAAPSIKASDAPSVATSATPSIKASDAPSIKASDAPSIKASDAPSIKASDAPSVAASDAPSIKASDAPSIKASDAPSVTTSFSPSVSPSHTPLLQCPSGEREFLLDLGAVGFVDNERSQRFALENGLTLFIDVTDSSPGVASNWSFNNINGCLEFQATNVLDYSDIVQSDGSTVPFFPFGYSTLELRFDRQVSLAYAKMQDIDSNSDRSDAVRIVAKDIIGDNVGGIYTPSLDLYFKDNWSYMKPSNQVSAESALVFEPEKNIGSILFDVSTFGYNAADIGTPKTGSVCQELRYCAPATPICLNCVKVDFELDDSGKLLKNGNFVDLDWKTLYGLTIDATDTSSCQTGSKPRIFDSSRPGNFGDLGTPNKHCHNGGVGEGVGGEIGSVGENCEARKNVLIIEKADTNLLPTPCDSLETITFEFDNGTDFEYLTLLDAPDSGSISYTLVGGLTTTINYANVQVNGIQRIDIDQSNVKSIQVQMKPGMAIVDLKFCVPCDRVPTPPPTPACVFECNTIDFNYKRDGTPLDPGIYVMDQWSESYTGGAGYGMTISILPSNPTSTSGWWSPEQSTTPAPWNVPGLLSGRLFDTANPVDDWNNANAGGDPDLGAPNQHCPGITDHKVAGGRYYGEGNPAAGPGGVGENCRELGNVLIIQEFEVVDTGAANNHGGRWDDSSAGGYFYFEFADPVRFENVGIMDIDEEQDGLGNNVELVFEDGGTQIYKYEAYGGDTYQTVMTAADDVKRVMVKLPGNSAAISDLTFCNSVCSSV
eukprot:CAMPEP_0119003398 /NCGR_PEP_ID=MMETSP1176-20130426/535_1 /TAXON_ID=265551 /ORGANISM="Synedropsis recta cf, Strain CCMP1620" /LENGTH=1216 /DNA_ID=CAMNT_0006954997 /DNA_START=44 /DNA_END=3694 /DNA_ORIENTATION=+